ncbi:unnamed protein product [Cochlearia groenlandica]
MGLLTLMKKLGFIFLLVSASAFALSSATRPSILIYSQEDNHEVGFFEPQKVALWWWKERYMKMREY